MQWLSKNRKETLRDEFASFICDSLVSPCFQIDGAQQTAPSENHQTEKQKEWGMPLSTFHIFVNNWYDLTHLGLVMQTCIHVVGWRHWLKYWLESVVHLIKKKRKQNMSPIFPHCPIYAFIYFKVIFFSFVASSVFSLLLIIISLLWQGFRRFIAMHYILWNIRKMIKHWSVN